jgi:hypothetical protein
MAGPMNNSGVAGVVRDAMSGKKKKTEEVDLGSKGRFSIKKGAMTAAAQRAGETNSEYEQKHKDSPGLAGKRARLAITMKSWNHNK